MPISATLVKEGQVLARISDEEQRYLVAQQEAQLRQSLERLGLKNENDRLQNLEDAPDVRRARADLYDAETRYKRVRELVDQGIGPQSDLDQALARYQAAQAAYDQTLNQTRNLLQEVERFKASLSLQRKKLRDTVVRAPFTAFVKERQAVAGAYVRANTPLFTLVKTDPVRLRIEVLRAHEPVGARRAGGGSHRRGVRGPEVRRQGLAHLAHRRPDQAHLRRRGAHPEPRNELKPGSYARARLQTQKSETITVVPARAVLYVLGSNKSFVVEPDSTIDAAK